jgi:hypothetical protein
MVVHRPVAMRSDGVRAMVPPRAIAAHVWQTMIPKTTGRDMTQIRISGIQKAVILLLTTTLFSAGAIAQIQVKSPQPGDIYREYTRVMRPTDGELWRVTDPNVNTDQYPDAAAFLPNPSISLTVDDLSGAVRAEATMLIWGGHISTYGKKLRFNGNGWIAIPDLDTSNGIPAGHLGINYIAETMITVDIPLADLQEGYNTFEGVNEGQLSGPEGYGFGWGQHGWYGMMLRIYYNGSKAHPTGTITSPGQGGSLTGNPSITVGTSGSVDRVDVLAYYDGYDTDGDGKFLEYHHDYHLQPLDTELAIRNHVGTATSAPYVVNWNTKWVPDQAAGSVKLLARIRGTDGVWYVTPEVANLSLVRSGKSVRLYKPLDTPERAWGRGDLEVVRINVNIPESTTLSDATDAMYHNRTWNGLDVVREPGETHFRRLNEWDDPDEYGANHNFSYDTRAVPTNVLRTGNNEFSYFSQTVAHHGMEIMWPGPGLQVEYTGAGYASPVPLEASLASPAHNATNQPVSLTLRWHPAPAATAYELQVSTDSTFGSTVVNQTNIADTSYSVGPLSAMARYFWRVRGKNAAGNGDYSEFRAFNTNVGSPAPVSPLNAATNVAVIVPVVWHPVAGATQYRLQVATAVGFTVGTIVKDTTLSDTTKTLAGLGYNTQYYWHVAAQVSSAWGDYATPWSFTTAIAPAGIPGQLLPENNATDQTIALTMRWRTGTAAVTYHLQAGSDSAFTSGLIVNDTTLTDTSKSVSGLGYNQKYYWRVRSKNAGGYSEYSPIWNFRTVSSVPTAPDLLTPAVNAVEQPISNLVFSWRPLAGATIYTFQLATDSLFFVSGLVKNDTTVQDTSRPISGLTQNTKYFWRVAGRNAGGAGPFTQGRSFRTVQPVPGMVTLVSPGPQAVVTKDSARFSWNKPTDAGTRYWFEISIDSTFAMYTYIDSTIADTAVTFRPLTNGLNYYWHVRGGTASKWGEFSFKRRFSVVVTGVNTPASLPTEFTLAQNFPNPFNPSTQITFGLPKESTVRLEVFNLLGQQVAELANGVHAAGFHTVRFDASGLTSGMYLYKLTAGEMTLFRKMMLVK